MSTDPIADLLTIIRNGIKAKKMEVSAPYSKLKTAILETLKAQGIITDFKEDTSGKFKRIAITLGEHHHTVHLKRISKPGQRIYIKSEEIKPVRENMGFAIMSTSKGIMTNSEARKQKLGGEVICEIY